MKHSEVVITACLRKSMKFTSFGNAEERMNLAKKTAGGE
jgi:hypothetical protein